MLLPTLEKTLEVINWIESKTKRKPTMANDKTKPDNENKPENPGQGGDHGGGNDKPPVEPLPDEDIDENQPPGSDSPPAEPPPRFPVSAADAVDDYKNARI